MNKIKMLIWQQNRSCHRRHCCSRWRSYYYWFAAILKAHSHSSLLCFCANNFPFASVVPFSERLVTVFVFVFADCKRFLLYNILNILCFQSPFFQRCKKQYLLEWNGLFVINVVHLFSILLHVFFSSIAHSVSHFYFIVHIYMLCVAYIFRN